jgi:hypothetical protein
MLEVRTIPCPIATEIAALGRAATAAKRRGEYAEALNLARKAILLKPFSSLDHGIDLELRVGLYFELQGNANQAESYFLDLAESCLKISENGRGHFEATRIFEKLSILANRMGEIEKAEKYRFRSIDHHEAGARIAFADKPEDLKQRLENLNRIR